MEIEKVEVEMFEGLENVNKKICELEDETNKQMKNISFENLEVSF